MFQNQVQTSAFSFRMVLRDLKQRDSFGKLKIHNSLPPPQKTPTNPPKNPEHKQKKLKKTPNYINLPPKTAQQPPHISLLCNQVIVPLYRCLAVYFMAQWMPCVKYWMTNPSLRSGCVNFNYSVGRTLITTTAALYLLFGLSLEFLDLQKFSFYDLFGFFSF